MATNNQTFLKSDQDTTEDASADLEAFWIVVNRLRRIKSRDGALNRGDYYYLAAAAEIERLLAEREEVLSYIKDKGALETAKDIRRILHVE